MGGRESRPLLGLSALTRCNEDGQRGEWGQGVRAGE